MKFPFFGKSGDRPSQSETRATPKLIGTPFFPSTPIGVSPRLAESVAGVLACVNVVASAIASLPASVYQSRDGGRFEAPSHPVSRLIRSANAFQTWPDAIQWLISETLLWGNGLLWVQADGAGRPIALIPVPWCHVTPELTTSGRMVYRISGYLSPWTGAGRELILLQDEVLHLKDRGDGPFVGRSRISRSVPTIKNALREQEYSEALYRNPLKPGGVVTLPQGTSEDVYQKFLARVSQNKGVSAAGKTLVLTDGALFTPLSISTQDAEILSERSFTLQELCRIFQVPPPLVQDYSNSTFTNSQSAAQWFAQFTLQPWINALEAEFSRSVFGSSSPFSLNIDMGGLIRGDYAARWGSYAVAVQNGILNRNEIREQEGFNPVPGGENFGPAPGQAPEPPAATE